MYKDVRFEPRPVVANNNFGDLVISNKEIIDVNRSEGIIFFINQKLLYLYIGSLTRLNKLFPRLIYIKFKVLKISSNV
jgi:hypothetical protein